MTGFGSPCGACKFLRRKCVRGCVFAPYFCHEQGATHFAAIHKVFGASNVSKLLMHLPVNDRSEAAITISYEAQARLQDPIYGCVAHIFALQQQVVNLQAQVASLKAQAGQVLGNGSNATLTPQEEKLYQKFPPCQQDGQGFFQSGDGRMQSFLLNSSTNTESMNYCNSELSESNSIQSSQMYNPHSGLTDENMPIGIEEDPCCATATLGMQPSTWTSAYHDMEDLQSVTFAYLHGS
ncbi:LOB domain-containing protein CRL1-like [Cocos nucifera]|uniref:LOB domain-containing protein CRL1-like n=1 Tax=Cocos nucifera TaxID=13894 RepID=A0A8K0IF41_COCNU|nr:LOB domain-containing protein CRL1-like [Cocos nucifera]